MFRTANSYSGGCTDFDGHALDLEQLLDRSPMGLKGGDTNLRRYVGNNPTNATDPTGLRETDDRLTDRSIRLVDVSKKLEAKVNDVISEAWAWGLEEIRKWK